MPDYLLDSDVLIWCLRGRPDTVSFVESISSYSLPACSSLSVLEVELGMKKDEEKQTANLLDSLHVISVDRGIAGKAASCIRHYQTRGRHIDFVDAVIAATCLRENRVLVTYNLKHYPMPEIRKQTPSEQE